MKVVTGEKMREIDEQAVRTFKIPSVVLMENAGRAVADQAAALVPKGRGLLSWPVRVGMAATPW